MTTNPPLIAPLATLQARLARLATDPRVRLLPDGTAIVLELAAVLAMIADLDRRTRATDAQLAHLARLIELGTSDPGPCS